VTLTRTHTRTHTEISFANPYLVCDICRRPTDAWHDPEQCGPGCETEALNLPCEHLAGVVSTCPSWSPVDGCQCQDPSEHLALPTRS
jgi:hypothetical protein